MDENDEGAKSRLDEINSNTRHSFYAVVKKLKDCCADRLTRATLLDIILSSVCQRSDLHLKKLDTPNLKTDSLLPLQILQLHYSNEVFDWENVPQSLPIKSFPSIEMRKKTAQYIYLFPNKHQ
jgi:hypothetical protein